MTLWAELGSVVCMRIFCEISSQRELKSDDGEMPDELERIS